MRGVPLALPWLSKGLVGALGVVNAGVGPKLKFTEGVVEDAALPK